MPAYNAEPHLEQAIQSVLAQTLNDFEMIIVDDGSTDRTPEILAGLASRDARVKPHRLTKNLGIVAALNEGIRLASGKYIARMDADDFIPTYRFEKQIAFLQANPHIEVVSGAYELVDLEGRSLNRVINQYYKSPDIVRWGLYFGTPICHSAAMFLANVIRQAGCYRLEYQYVEDYDLFIRISKIAQLASLPDTLFYYRKGSEDSISNTKEKEQLHRGALLRQQLIFESLQKELPLNVCVFLNHPSLADPERSSDVLMACETILALYWHTLRRTPQMSIADRNLIRVSVNRRIRALLSVLPSRQWLWRMRLHFLR